jgi:predicted RNA binding protein YcfA (HicA-like mRNA interferase family)
VKPVSGKRMCKVLERRGWSLDRINGSHHVYESPDHPFTISVPVHGNRDIPTGTQRTIMRLAGLTDADLG